MGVVAGRGEGKVVKVMKMVEKVVRPSHVTTGRSAGT